MFEYFEDATLEFTFTGDWSRSTARALYGAHSFASAAVNDGQSSSTQTSVTVAADELKVVAFWYLTSSESADQLRFSIDATEQFAHGGQDTEWTRFDKVLAPGTYTLKWEFSKNAATSAGDDAAYIDALQFVDLDTTIIVNEIGASVPYPIPPENYTLGTSFIDGHPFFAKDVLYGGRGRISGTVVDKDSNPLERYVLLLDRRTHLVAKSTWSNPDGSYTFDWIDDRLYTILAHDYAGQYNAVVEDNVQAKIPAGRQ